MNLTTIQLTVKTAFSVLAVIFYGAGFAGPVSGSDIATAQTDAVVLVGAGDIASCSYDRDSATARLLDRIPGTVFTLGDNAYPNGKITDFKNCYEPTWGRHKHRTRPSVGNHEYHSGGAAGYYTYFGRAATPRQPKCTRNCQGYYSYNLGAWHIIVLNSEISMHTGSAQERWLRADLKANPRTCTLAYWHRPRFSSGKHGNYTRAQPLWQALYDHGADVVLNAHDHFYERFAPQNPSGKADPTRGIRQFIVGTGGANLYGIDNIKANSQVRNTKSWGVLKLTLYQTSYQWQFIPIAGKTFTDSGSANCVRKRAVSPNLIFSDSFESGSLKAWSASRSDGGDLSVTRAAALAGNGGLQTRLDDNRPIYVTDNSPSREAIYRARFRFDPNSIRIAGGNSHIIFQGYTGASTPVLRMEFRFRNGNYLLRAILRNDDSTWKSSNWILIEDASQSVQLSWRAARGPNTNDGGLTVWINGARKTNLTGMNNDTRRIDRIHLGAVAGIDSGTRGTYYFDAFRSWR